ncbi:hypothetical protein SEA_RASOVI_50 [Microbacterium phage Rasovi]|nr:hypothetical protein SEA_RASOVI_50 [Microbacterium phage Rasovi]
MGAFTDACASHDRAQVRTELGIQIGTGAVATSPLPRSAVVDVVKPPPKGDKLSGLTRNCPVSHGPPATPPATYLTTGQRCGCL